MNEKDLQNALKTVIETLIDARDEIEGDDDDLTLADCTRDMATDTDAVAAARTFEDAGLLTSNHGLVLTTADGSEFQITIVRRR